MPYEMMIEWAIERLHVKHVVVSKRTALMIKVELIYYVVTSITATARLLTFIINMTVDSIRIWST